MGGGCQHRRYDTRRKTHYRQVWNGQRVKLFSQKKKCHFTLVECRLPQTQTLKLLPSGSKTLFPKRSITPSEDLLRTPLSFMLWLLIGYYLRTERYCISLLTGLSALSITVSTGAQLGLCYRMEMGRDFSSRLASNLNGLLQQLWFGY